MTKVGIITNISIQRHFGLDWLRIGAFAILIFYHSAMYFGPFHWVLKAANPVDCLAWPLVAISPWRLMILFTVSGYATSAMLMKFPKLSAFLKERSKRLLLPLMFGMAVLVPPQSWVRLVDQHGYTGSFTHFWTSDYFGFHMISGQALPHWEHLWFLGYLWAYTALLTAVIAAVPDWHRYFGRVVQWLSHGYRLLAVPVVILVFLRLMLTKEGFADHGMFDDLIGDVHYIPAFLFGFLLAHFPILWTAIRKCWRVALAGSIAAYAVLGYAVYAGSVANNMPTWLHVAETVADTVMAWLMVPVALQFADYTLNHDHRWRATLAQAVFPAYLVHQTVIVLTGWLLLRYDWPNIVGFALIITMVISASAAVYILASRVSWLGRLLGVVAKPALHTGNPIPAKN